MARVTDMTHGRPIRLILLFSLPLMLAQQIGFGLLCGAAAGRLAVWCMDRFSFQIEEGNTIFAVAAMLVSYALPQVIGGNGYLAVYLCGIIMGNSRIPEKRNLMHVFDTVTGIAQMMIFFLLGLLAIPSELPAVLFPAALITLFLTVVARPAAVAAILLPFRSHLRQAWYPGQACAARHPLYSQSWPF